MAKIYDRNYVRNQEKIKERQLSIILNKEKNYLISILEKESKSTKSIVDEFTKKTKDWIPKYLITALPTVMNRAMQNVKSKFKEIPKNYTLWFNIETSPASNYIRDVAKWQWWMIEKTTSDELKKIIANWIDDWKSYWEIWKLIRETDPFVFSRARANLIAVQEVWQAYWFWNYQPMKDISDEFVIMKRWITSHDHLVRPEHQENEDQDWIPLEDTFAWTWDEFAPSTDFNCRCFQEDRIVWIK